MASDSIPRSLREPSPRQLICELLEQRLMLRLSASQREEAEAARDQVDLGPHQPVGPQGIHLEAPAQYLDGAPSVAAPQEDHPTAGVGLQVQRPALGERATTRGR